MYIKRTIFILIFFFIDRLSSQCAMCKAVVEGGNENIAKGVNDGITYLMIFPYILVGVLCYFLYQHRKKIKN